MFFYLTDEEKAELEEIALENDDQANNWNTDWTGHDELYDRINSAAPGILRSLLKQHNPTMADLFCEVFWELK